MGVRLNITANPPVRAEFEPSQPVAAQAGVGASDLRAPKGSESTKPSQRPAAAPVAPRPETPSAPEPTQRPVAAPTTAPRTQTPRANPADQRQPAVESAQPQAKAQPQVDQAQVAEIRSADIEANATLEPNSAPAARLRRFRFFSAAESMRERELAVRLNRLESELESANRRLQTGDSFSLHADAQLDGARLRSDLEMVQSQIARLRLQQVFGGPAAQMGSTDVAIPAPQAPPVEAQPASEEAQSLNLLA